jgi:hypothetical protein
MKIPAWQRKVKAKKAFSSSPKGRREEGGTQTIVSETGSSRVFIPVYLYTIESAMSAYLRLLCLQRGSEPRLTVSTRTPPTVLLDGCG